MGIMKKIAFIVTGLVELGTWEARAQAKVDFTKNIQPILQKSCYECHGPEKQKAKLRLDSKEAALKGGKDGVVIVPGQADKSEMYRRITLPAGNDDVMPSKGDLLTKAQTDLIRDWINQGANWPEGASIAAAGKKTEETAAPAAGKLPDYKPSGAELKAVAKLDSLGIAARPIAANLNWREVNFHGQSGEVLEKALVPLKEVLGLYELNLGSSKIKDADLANIAGLTNLNRLYLENTPVTDAGLVHLKGLVHLTYLNLYGTPITDSGLEQLKGMTHLRHLYLWQTKTTDAGVADLKKALPHVDISTGAELKEFAKQEAQKEKEKEKEKAKEKEKQKKEEKK